MCTLSWSPLRLVANTRTAGKPAVAPGAWLQMDSEIGVPIMTTANDTNYDLCLIHQPEGHLDLFVASFLGDVSEQGGGLEDCSLNGCDVTNGLAISVGYLSDSVVTLTSENEIAQSVIDAIQGIPSNCVQVSSNNGTRVIAPSVISKHDGWTRRRLQIRFDTHFENHANVQALIRHAKAFEFAIGGSPEGISLPKRAVVSVADQYYSAALKITLKAGMVIPFNNSTEIRGFLILLQPFSGTGTCFDCDCYFRGTIASGAPLTRIVNYFDQRKNENVRFQSKIGEVVAKELELGIPTTSTFPIL